MREIPGLTETQLETVRALIRRYLPHVLVWAYGSRVTDTYRPESDLDLVVFGDSEMKEEFCALREAFEESDLSFRVDLFRWSDVPDTFHEVMRNNHIVVQEAAD